MAAKKMTLEDNMTFVAEPKEEKKELKVTIRLPRLEEEGNGVKVDQYERVTLANENGEDTLMILRGENVDIPVRFFPVLKEKYPDL